MILPPAYIPEDAVYKGTDVGRAKSFALIDRLIDRGRVGDFIEKEDLIKGQPEDVEVGFGILTGK